jgi:hypothetical protein
MPGRISLFAIGTEEVSPGDFQWRRSSLMPKS